MTDKDPKDMTVSELLRLAANGEENEYGYRSPSGKLFCLLLGTDVYTVHTDEGRRSLRSLADKIDAELAQARKEAVKESKKPMWWFRFAISQGEDWPEPQEGESFRHYLDRCFIPRPRFEDGEPVHIGDKVEHPYTGETCTINCINTLDGSYRLGFVEGSSALLLDRERVKRPAPEVLLGDGKPVSKGETVYVIESGIERTVNDFGTKLFEGMDCWDGSPWVMFDNGSWMHARELTHTPPDTQEKINADKNLMWTIYWDCTKRDCLGCDVLHGKSPSEYYNVHNCSVAQGLDIARRQAELDKRTGGDA